MKRILRTSALAIILMACKDSVGPKPPSAKSTVVEVITTVSKAQLGVGDTATFGYSLKNISADSLTLTTNDGCQIRPELDQVDGPKIPNLLELLCPTAQTVLVLAPGEKVAYGIVLRGYDKTKATDLQQPGYLLSTGTFDASMLVTANELPAPVRSDWIRFTVK
ncbi:MAG: hypothetical protein AABZ80_12790 [Gemmatimonadota bacterium]